MKFQAVNIAEEIPAPTLEAFLEAAHPTHQGDRPGVLDEECETCRPIVKAGILTLVPLDATQDKIARAIEAIGGSDHEGAPVIPLLFSDQAAARKGAEVKLGRLGLDVERIRAAAEAPDGS